MQTLLGQDSRYSSMLFYLFLSVRHTGILSSNKKIAGYIKLTSGPCAYSVTDL